MMKRVITPIALIGMLTGCGSVQAISNNTAATKVQHSTYIHMTTQQMSKMMTNVNDALQYEYDTFSSSDGSRQWLSSDEQQFDIVNSAWESIQNATPTGEITSTAQWKVQSDVRLTIDDAWNAMNDIQQYANGQMDKSDMSQYMQFYKQQLDQTLKELHAK